jgi:plastocyanin
MGGTASSTVPTPTGSNSGSAMGDDTSSGDKMTIEIVDTAFQPGEATVKVGTKVTWKQTGDQPHSATSVDEIFDSSPDCSPLNSDEGCFGSGDSYSYTFDEPGTYDYYCRIHGTTTGRGMIGTVTVE